MRRFGGSVSLACGILGIFAPFIDAFGALLSTRDRLVIDANPFAIAIGAFSAVVVMLLAGTILNRSSRLFPVLLIGYCVLAIAMSLGDITRFLLWAAMFGAILSLFGRRKIYHP